MSSELALTFLRTAAAQRDEHGAPTLFYAAALGGLEEAEAEAGRARVVLRVTPEMCHFGGSMHGGAVATLVDIVTATAMLTVKRGGVSLSISATYLGMAHLGSRVVCEAKVVKAGRVLVVLDMDMRVEGTGELVAQGQHLMFCSSQAPPLEKFMAKYMRASPSTQQAAREGGSVSASSGSHAGGGAGASSAPFSRAKL